MQKRHARDDDANRFADEPQTDVFMAVADTLGYQVKNNVEDYSSGVSNDLAKITGAYVRGEIMTATFARLNGAMLGERIDATYYRPEYIANELRLRESGLDVVPLSSLVTSGRRAVYFDTSTLEDTAAPSDGCLF